MVAFARAKTKSIFSKLRLTSISKKQIETHEKVRNDDLCIKTDRSSNNFLEAIKRGGVWLS